MPLQNLTLELLRLVFHQLTLSGLKDISLVCRVFKEVASEYLFENLIVPFDEEKRTIPKSTLLNILASSDSALHCIKHLVFRPDLTPKEEWIYDGNEISLFKECEPDLLIDIIKRLRPGQLRSMILPPQTNIPFHVLLALFKLQPTIKRLELYMSGVWQSTYKEFQASQGPTNLRFLRFDLNRFGNRNYGAVLHPFFELVSASSSTIETLVLTAATDSEIFRQTERRLQSGTLAESQNLIRKGATQIPVSLPRLKSLDMRGIPHLDGQYSQFGLTFLNPALLTDLKLIQCYASDAVVRAVSPELNGLKRLIIMRSCEWDTIIFMLAVVPLLEELYLEFQSQSSGQEGSGFSYECLVRHRDTLKELWLHDLAKIEWGQWYGIPGLMPGSGELEQMEKQLGTPFLREGWGNLRSLGTQVGSFRALRGLTSLEILRVLPSFKTPGDDEDNEIHYYARRFLDNLVNDAWEESRSRPKLKCLVVSVNDTYNTESMITSHRLLKYKPLDEDKEKSIVDFDITHTAAVKKRVPGFKMIGFDLGEALE